MINSIPIVLDSPKNRVCKSKKERLTTKQKAKLRVPQNGHAPLTDLKVIRVVGRSLW